MNYLLPTSPSPLDDQLLDRTLHDLFVGVTGIDPTLVRPRWTAEPGNMPAFNTSWIAQGITYRRDDVVASQTLSLDGLSTTVTRNQELDCLVSCYGASASALQALIRDGLSLNQNREAINALGIVLVSVGGTRNMAMLINQRWNGRIDCTITFRRMITRVYAVQSLLSATTMLKTDNLTETIIN